MKRILVVGNAGAGKSTVGKLLSSRLGLPYVNMDTVRWTSGWSPTPVDERRRALQEIADRSRWVVDGTAPPLFREADTIVFLDIPRGICLRRILRRAMVYRFRCRPELPRCPELMGLHLQLWYLWKFPRTYRPRILSLARTGVDFIHVRGGQDLFRLLRLLRAGSAARTGQGAWAVQGAGAES